VCATETAEYVNEVRGAAGYNQIISARTAYRQHPRQNVRDGADPYDGHDERDRVVFPFCPAVWYRGGQHERNRRTESPPNDWQ